MSGETFVGLIAHANQCVAAGIEVDFEDVRRADLGKVKVLPVRGYIAVAGDGGKVNRSQGTAIFGRVALNVLRLLNNQELFSARIQD